MTQQKAGREGPWLYDRRVRWLLELSMDEDEHVRFGIEGMDGQLIIALDERLLVVKLGFVRGDRLWWAGSEHPLTLTSTT